MSRHNNGREERFGELVLFMLLHFSRGEGIGGEENQTLDFCDHPQEMGDAYFQCSIGNY